MADTLGGILFEEAIAWLRRRLRISTPEWQAMLKGIDQVAEGIVDAQLEAINQELLQAVLDAVEAGTTVETFQGDYERIVKANGWAYKDDPDKAAWHSRLIFRMQTGNAYAAGRWEQIQRVLKANQGRTDYYLRYVTVGDERVRHNHAEWHGIILRPDHPFWLTHWPPNGFNCRCPPPTLITGRVIKRQGWTVTADDDPRLAIPPDEGFSGNVGVAMLQASAPAGAAVEADIGS